MGQTNFKAGLNDCLLPNHNQTDAILSIFQRSPKLKIGKVLGRGSRSVVYQLPDFENFVLQTKRSVSEHISIKTKHLEVIDNPISELNIGQPVLKSHHEEFCLLQRQAGISYSMPFAKLFQKYGINELLGHNQPVKSEDTAPYRQAYASHLKKIAAMPQHSYNELAKRVLLIQKRGLFWDPCSLNILVDFKNLTFNTIDHYEAIGPYENLLGIACALMDTMYVFLDEQADPQNCESVANNKQLIQFRKQILTKLIFAAQQEGLPLPKEVCPKNNFGFHQSSFDMNYVLKISGVNFDFKNLQNLFLAQDTLLSASIAA